MNIYEYDEERHMRQTREEGVEEGFASGLEQGIERGSKQKGNQIAINLINTGILTDKQICEATGLRLEELDELKKILPEG